MNAENFDLPRLLNQLEIKLVTLMKQRQLTNPVMIGIHSGGAWIAEELHQRLKINEPFGLMDISFYRDDFSQIGMHPKTKPSFIPMSLEGRDIILIDDVFYTGRTARAALNEIFDFGRPNKVLFAVLIERDGQQIPLKPDCSGLFVTVGKDTYIKLAGPKPLSIQLSSSKRPL
ncbi:MAG: bifunctional pyr operon transcriptional regulator/uracil phosphoribosyltransferase PyrR [Methylococcales bacterium]|nr:bifunctional pyr operon transcriptional regulator/uracil phosphoribosyltransferase PyrR [Methylococcales bacterium]